MTMNPRESDFTTKQEGSTSSEKIRKVSSSPTPWSRMKDPRVARVSRAFGGKDRHSKVCTVRGLRDRRVRLSVPTAIQLYDLQDRLGLNQPSKVVDWLLNAAKLEIDELPPLQMPPGNFEQIHQPMLTSDQEAVASQCIKQGFKINSVNWDDHPLALSKSNFWNLEAGMRDKPKGVATEAADDGKEDWINIRRNQEEKQDGLEGVHLDTCNISANNILPRLGHSSSPGLQNNVLPCNSFYCWDPSGFALSHLGSHGFTVPQTEELHSLNVMPLPSGLPLPSGSQLFVRPPGLTQSYFPPHVTVASVESDPKQVNNLQMLSSSSQNPISNSLTQPLYPISQSMRPFDLGTSTPRKLVPSQSNKVNEFLTK